MENQTQDNKLNNAIVNVFTKLSSIVNPLDKVLLKTPLKSVPVTQRRFLILIMSFFAILILFLFVVGMIFQAVNKAPSTPQNLTPANIEQVNLKENEIRNPSAYANDPEILNLNIKVNEVQKSLDSFNVSDAKLNPPLLKYEIEF